MVSRGYRIYTFELISGRSTELAQELPENRERLEKVLSKIGKQTRVGNPKRSSSGMEFNAEELVSTSDYEGTDATLSVRGCDLDPEMGILHANIALGERGLHDLAISPDGLSAPYSVKDRSAETPRRVDFYFGSAGFTGLLVAESVGMKDPVPVLVKWIRSVSQAERQERLKALENISSYVNENGEEISKTAAKQSVPSALSIRVKRLADPELFERILDEIESMHAEFTELDENNKETQKKLVFTVKEEAARRNIIDRLRDSKSSDTEKIILETLEDLDINPDGLETANIDFQNMKARIKGKDGNTVLEPGRFSDLFNYRFDAKGRPGTSSYYAITLNKITKLKQVGGLPIEIPELQEVIAWVDREESRWMPQARVSVG